MQSTPSPGRGVRVQAAGKLGEGWVKLQRVVVSAESFADEQVRVQLQFGLIRKPSRSDGLAIYN